MTNFLLVQGFHAPLTRSSGSQTREQPAAWTYVPFFTCEMTENSRSRKFALLFNRYSLLSAPEQSVVVLSLQLCTAYSSEVMLLAVPI